MEQQEQPELRPGIYWPEPEQPELQEPTTFGVTEAAREMGVSPNYLRKMLRADRVQGAFKNENGHWRITEDSYIVPARRRTYVRLRIESFELCIGTHEGFGRYEEANALRRFCKANCIPIDESKIRATMKDAQAFLADR